MKIRTIPEPFQIHLLFLVFIFTTMACQVQKPEWDMKPLPINTKWATEVDPQAPWPEYQLRGAALEAEAHRGGGDFAAALEKYDAVIASPTSGSVAERQRTLALAGKAACMAELGQHSEAIRMLDEIIANNDPQDTQLFARTYNALGTCYRQADQPVDAVLAYLRVHIPAER